MLDLVEQTGLEVAELRDRAEDARVHRYADQPIVAIDPPRVGLLRLDHADEAHVDGIAVDGAGSAYVTGGTDSTEATFPVTVGPDLTYNGAIDAFVAKVSGESCCAVAAAPIAALLAVKQPLALDNIEMQWQPDPVASGYNIWYVGRKQDIPFARQASQPPAVPVTGCAVPNPASITTCTDLAAVSRGAPASFFYQVRAYCDPLTEGP